MCTNIHEFARGEKVLSVTPETYASTPISRLLCGNFIEVGFGYQVESMWTEMLYNRSFEKPFPIMQGTYDWFGGERGLDTTWEKEAWYNTSYEHNRWYAFPGTDRPACITPDASYLIEHTPGYTLTLCQREGGVHGKHWLEIINDDDREAGLAQDGKYIRRGETYHFSGYFQHVSGCPDGVELRMYDTAAGKDCTPFVRVPLSPLTAEGAWQSVTFTSESFEGWATFALLVQGHTTILVDAFSLMPEHSVKGWRPDVVEKLRELKPSVLRFPGGNFASLHRWTDAIGPRNSRKPEPSVMWGDLNYNDVGTDEFLQLCEEIQAQPLMLVNMFHPAKQYYFMAFPELAGFQVSRHGQNLTHILDREEGIEVARQWVEYCNGSVDTPMGRLRAANGHPEPYRVRYWEMDNETWRWFTKDEYAAYVNRYAQAMRSVDPTIQIGICSYHAFSEVIEDILKQCGHAIDFIADRMCEPFNIQRKLAILQRYNKTHTHQLYYTDTEALQNRPLALAPFTRAYYEKHGIGFCDSRRTWLYALTMAGNLLHYQRYGSLVQFMCFNNLCNTAGQSCIEVSKTETILSAAGIMLSQMARTQAAWPLRIEGYEADSLKSIEVQAAWNEDRSRIVINLVNKCDEATPITLALSGLGLSGTVPVQRISLWAEDGDAQETILHHGSIKRACVYGTLNVDEPCSFMAPAFSFSEIVIGR